MKEILIKHITNLLTLTKQDKIRPKKFGNKYIVFGGIDIYYKKYIHLTTVEILEVVIGRDEYKIYSSDVLNLFKETAKVLESKREQFESEKLDKQLKGIIEKLQR